MDDLEAAAEALGIERSYFDALGRSRAVASDDLGRIVARFGGRPATPPPVVRVVRANRPATTPSAALSPGDIVIRAPETAFRPRFSAEGRRVWVLAVQLYGVRSRRNWGHGDFTDLLHLVELAHAVGAAGIGLNPLHALFLDRPEDASPYSPNSRLFLNPLYIDVTALPEGRDLAPDDLAELRAADLVDYAGVAQRKRAALRRAFERFAEGAEDARRTAFQDYCARAGDLLVRFAAFETLRSRFSGPWWEWPEPWRRPDPSAIAELQRTAAEDIRFHQFLQWIADEQLHACTHRAQTLGLPIGLYLDMAVGVDPNGADAWAEQGAVVHGLSIGAPPDLLNPAGQNWGLVSFSPRALIESDFLLLRRTLRALMRYAGAIRIDHVLGLNRFFLIPEGHDANHGTYVRFPLEAMLAVLAQESVTARCLVIGEDLGTVPEGFRDVLLDWNVWSYRLMLFERDESGYFAPEIYPRDALVAFTTHDLPTFAGWTSDHDLVVKRALGVDPGEDEDDRRRARDALRRTFAHHGISHGEPTFLDVTRYLARTPCGVLAVNIEDVLALADQVNVPGTIREHPNWRRRLPIDLEDLVGDARLARVAEVLAEEGRGGRS